MRVSIGKIKKFIQESFIRLNEDNTVPKAIRGRAVEIQYYPPGSTQDPQDNKPNRRDLFLAVNNRGDTVGFGNSEEEVVRSVSGKYFIKKRRGSKQIARNMRQGFQPGQTEYVDMRHGHVVGVSDEKGNWLAANESLRSFIKNIINETRIDQIFKPKVTGPDACTDCRGTGKYMGMFGPEDCQKCGGTGQNQELNDPNGPGIDDSEVISHEIINPIVIKFIENPDDEYSDPYYVVWVVESSYTYSISIIPEILHDLDSVGIEIREVSRLDPNLFVSLVKDLQQEWDSTHVVWLTQYIYTIDEFISKIHYLHP